MSTVNIFQTENRVVVLEDRVVVHAPAVQGPRGPQGESAVGQLANTAIIAGDGLSGGGTLDSNVTVSVDSTVVRTAGDQNISGNKRFGATLYVDSANSRVGVNNLDPKIDLQIGDVGLGTFKLNTNSTMSNQIADSFSALDFRSAKYQVQVYSNTVNQYEISEIFLMHDDSNVFITEYAIINQGERLMAFDASIHNSTVRLLCDPTHAINEVKVFRTVLSA